MDYTGIYQEREARLIKMSRDPTFVRGAQEFYRTHPVEFIDDWGVTYDPRNAQKNLPTYLPFILFPRQKEFINFLQDCLSQQEHGLVEKSRDMGATWLCCAYAVWLWLFFPGVSVGFGSRKEMLVHRLGDPDSIFEKIRIFIDYLPRFLWPKKFTLEEHARMLKFLNPETGSTITGEAGDQIGRGGRKTIYFKDEAAHYERPLVIEAAIGDTTPVAIDVSSVSGTGTVFEQKRKAGEIWIPEKTIEPGRTRVFIFDWRDHPEKTQEWYDRRRAKAEREGLLHVFAQEVDRDYSAAAEGIAIKAIWVKAAVDAHERVGWSPVGAKTAGLDVANEAEDQNAFCYVHGNVILDVREWPEGDTSETAQKAICLMQKFGIPNLQYDSIGVGAGVKGETNRLKKEGLFADLEIVGWAGSYKPVGGKRRIIPGDKKSPRVKDFFRNLKAQAWWNLRDRFEKTYNAVTKGVEYPTEELVSISSKIKDLYNFISQLSQATYSLDSVGRVIIDKKPSGARSPNAADACVMAFSPVKKAKVLI